MKDNKHQILKQQCYSLFWKLPEGAQSFVFFWQLRRSKLMQRFYWSENQNDGNKIP